MNDREEQGTQHGIASVFFYIVSVTEQDHAFPLASLTRLFRVSDQSRAMDRWVVRQSAKVIAA